MTVLLSILVILALVIAYALFLRLGAITVEHTRVLVCSIGGAPDQVRQRVDDARIYREFYRDVDELNFAGFPAMLDAIQDAGYQIVHIAENPAEPADVQPYERIGAACSEARVRFLVLAGGRGDFPHAARSLIRENDGKRPSIVWVRDRRGERFEHFWRQLLSEISHGVPLLMAWPKLTNAGGQPSAATTHTLPDTLVFPGYLVRLLP